MFNFLKKCLSNVMGAKTVLQMDHTVMPPSAVRGMTKLDKNAFEKHIRFPTLLVPVDTIRHCKKILRGKLPDLQLKVVQDNLNGNGKNKFIFLDPQAKLEDSDLSKLENLGIETNLIYKEISIGYEHFKARDVLRAVLPMHNNNPKDELSISPKGFIQIGHILQLNLREHQLPYKHIIGQVLLDKVNKAKTVVNKVDNVSSPYRNLDMEILAGEDNFMTRVVEHYRTYEFDFSKVFWNSRLSTEHHNMSTLIPKSDIVFDVCAGVGPFSIPLAKKGCVVHANDLNPDCHHWMSHNVKLNKVKTMSCYNMDGREFIKKTLKEYLIKNNSDKSSTIHVIMNLPGNAVEFLDAFPGLFSQNISLPQIKVYFYIFAGTDFRNEINSRALKYLSVSLPEDTDIRQVRDVSPSKNQYCVSFNLPHQLLFSNDQSFIEDDEPESKRVRI